jgi:hydrogenase maturation factor HypF (carbamoyltransferase family)
MEERTAIDRSEFVRCLDCGTEYRLPRDNRAEATPCPTCGGVGWVTAAARSATQQKKS